MNKLRIALIACAAALATLMSQTSLAYYTVTGTATNVITSGIIEMAIREKTASGEDFPSQGVYVMPGDRVSKIVTVESLCNHPFYLRIKLVDGINDVTLSAEKVFDIEINDAYWTLKDGYYYYNDIVIPGESTQPLFSEVRIVGHEVDNRHLGKILSLTVDASAVQVQNNPADFPWEAAGWPQEGGNG